MKLPYSSWLEEAEEELAHIAKEENKTFEETASKYYQLYKESIFDVEY